MNTDYLPDFLIAGFPRCGTKNLVAYVSQHPEICMPMGKREIHYFDENHKKGEEWYKKHFEDCEKDKIKGEKTASYALYEYSAKRIINDLEDIKIIFLIRNPIDRTYSNYWQAVKTGQERSSFEEAIRKKKEKYVGGSCYVDKLKNFEKIPDQNKLIMVSESFWSDPVEKAKKVYEFVDADKTFTPEKVNRIKKGKSTRSKTLARIGYNRYDFPFITGRSKLENLLRDIVNAINLKTDYPDMDSKTREHLRSLFKGKNKELEEYLDENLSEKWGMDDL